MVQQIAQTLHNDWPCAGQALGKDFAVAAMAAVDVIVHVEQERLTDRRCFLTNRQVGRAAMVVFHAIFF